MSEPKAVYNLDDQTVKRGLMQKIGSMRGLWEVHLKPRKLTRSLNQNSYYHSAYCAVFRQWLQEEWGDPTISHLQAHIELKKNVLGVREKVNQRTGEVMELVPNTHDMTTDEFTMFLDKAAVWLAEYTGIEVLPASAFTEPTRKAS